MGGFSILGRDPPSQHHPIRPVSLAEAPIERRPRIPLRGPPFFCAANPRSYCGGFASRPPSAIGVTVLLAEGSHHARRQRYRPESPFHTAISLTHTAFRDIESHYIHASAALVSCHPRSCPAIPSHIRPCSLYAPGHTEAHREYEHQEYEKAAMRCMAALAWRILRESVSGEPGRLVTTRLHSAR